MSRMFAKSSPGSRAARRQAGGPVIGRTQCLGGFVQAGAQRAELALAVLLALAFLAGQIRGHHGSPGGWPLAARPLAAASNELRAWLATRWPSRRSRSPSAFWLSRSPFCLASVTMRTASAMSWPSWSRAWLTAASMLAADPPLAACGCRGATAAPAGPPGAGELTGCGAVDAAGRVPGHAVLAPRRHGRPAGIISGPGGCGRPGGDQGGNGCLGGLGGGVVEPGEVPGAGEYLDLAEYLDGDGLVGEPGADQRGVSAALGQPDMPGGHPPGPGCPALRGSARRSWYSRRAARSIRTRRVAASPEIWSSAASRSWTRTRSAGWSQRSAASRRSARPARSRSSCSVNSTRWPR